MALQGSTCHTRHINQLKYARWGKYSSNVQGSLPTHRMSDQIELIQAQRIRNSDHTLSLNPNGVISVTRFVTRPITQKVNRDTIKRTLQPLNRMSPNSMKG
jgi:hypothetical protein